MLRKLRGDLSAPVLAIIVTIGVIAAGLVLMAWFWWFAPTAGRAGALQVVGQPALIYGEGEAKLTITLRNVGNADVRVTGVYVKGVECDLQDQEDSIPITPGQAKTVVATCDNLDIGDEHSVEGVVLSTGGTYAFSAVVVKA